MRDRNRHKQQWYFHSIFFWAVLSICICGSLADDTLRTVGAYSCSEGAAVITVSNFSFVFDRASNSVTYSVEGDSTEQVPVLAYGNVILDENVDLCYDNVTELCPVPQGHVQRSGNHSVPAKYTQGIADIAYKVPDLQATIYIQLFNASNPSQNLGCFTSDITNGKSANVSAVKYLTIALAGAALAVSGISSAANSGGSVSAAVPPVHAPIITGIEGHGTSTAVSGAAGTGAPIATTAHAPPVSGPGTNVAAGGFHAPGFSDFFGVLQGIAVSGMYSVNYPTVYRSFSQNVGWSVGMITWAGMQESIDTFRKHTGGNLTESNYEMLKNTTLIYETPLNQNLTFGNLGSPINNTGSSNSTSGTGSFTKRMIMLYMRDNSTSPSTTPAPQQQTYVRLVTGIQAYVEKLTIPSTNTFMTLLIWWAIIVGISITAILGLKLILEAWSLKGHISKKFEGFRERYWIILGATLVRIILILYGVWVLWCLYQFKIKDSWGARLLAGLTLGIFTLVLGLFTLRIFILARRASKHEDGLRHLFEHKPWIRKYGLFYDQFKIDYWWCFVPFLVASFGRNAFLALGYGNGLVQVVGQLVIEVILASFLIVTMPFNTRMGNGLNLAIQVIRIISLVLILMFTVQLNIRQIATTAIGMVLLVIQSVLTITLGILIFINATIGLFHMAFRARKQKKEKLKEKNIAENDYEEGSRISSFNDRASDDLTNLSAIEQYKIKAWSSKLRKGRSSLTNASEQIPEGDEAEISVVTNDQSFSSTDSSSSRKSRSQKMLSKMRNGISLRSSTIPRKPEIQMSTPSIPDANSARFDYDGSSSASSASTNRPLLQKSSPTLSHGPSSSTNTTDSASRADKDNFSWEHNLI